MAVAMACHASGVCLNSRAMTKQPKKPGPKPMSAEDYLAKYQTAVEDIRAGMFVRQVMERHGISNPTVCLIRRAMREAGWVPPVKPPKARVYVPGPPRPPALTPAELVGRHADIAFWLRAGNRSIAWIVDRTGKSGGTVRLVKRLLIAMGEEVTLAKGGPTGPAAT